MPYSPVLKMPYSPATRERFIKRMSMLEQILFDLTSAVLSNPKVQSIVASTWKACRSIASKIKGDKNKKPL